MAQGRNPCDVLSMEGLSAVCDALDIEKRCPPLIDVLLREGCEFAWSIKNKYLSVRAECDRNQKIE